MTVSEARIIAEGMVKAANSQLVNFFDAAILCEKWMDEQ